MYTHLTTVTSVYSSYPASSEYAYSSSNGSYRRFTNSDETTEFDQSQAGGGASGSTYNSDTNGKETYLFQSSVVAGGNANAGTDETSVSSSFVSRWELFSTNSIAPFSVYSGSYSVSYEAITDGTYTYQEYGTWAASNYGDYTTSTGNAGYSATENTIIDSGTLEVSYPLNLIPTSFTAPSFITQSITISITSTSISMVSFDFLGTAYSTNVTTSITSQSNIEYQTTISAYTTKKHFFATSFAKNNASFTLITETNESGIQISPIACYAKSPSTISFSGEQVSFSTNTNGFLIIPPNPIYKNHLPQVFTSAPYSGASSTTISSESVFQIHDDFTYNEDSALSSKKFLNYTYDGNSAAFFSEESSFTFRSSSSRDLTFTSWTTKSSSAYTTEDTITIGETYQSRRLGILDELGISSKSIKTISISIARYATGVITIPVAASPQYSTSTSYLYTDINTEETIYTTKGVVSSGRGAGRAYDDTININKILWLRPESAGEFRNSTENDEYIYRQKLWNDENRNGRGSFYEKTQDSYYDSFSEVAKVNFFQNRITYNASNIIPNYGILSELNSKGYKQLEFPAHGVGGTFIQTLNNSGDTFTSTFERRLLVGHNQVYDQSLMSFVFPEYTSSNTTFTNYTTWKVSYTNPYYTRINPDLQSQEVATSANFSSSIQFEYNIVSTYKESSCISPISSIDQIPDYISISPPISASIATFTKSYYITKINTSNNATESAITSYPESIFSSQDLIIFRPKFANYNQSIDTNFAFLGGYHTDTIQSGVTQTKTTMYWDIGTFSENTIFNFTSYIGSTYIDV
jgi:hypothetical protein